jgi:flagellar hook assembly protein FlgD
MTPVMTDVHDVITPSAELALSNYPNPFNPTTTICYTLPADGPVVIDIFNVRGQKVARLADEQQDAGMHSMQWNGTDQEGNAVGSGIFFCKVRSGEFTNSRKMILMK